MEQALYTSLPLLANDLHFEVQLLTEKDHQHPNRLSIGSCLKIVIHRRDSEITVFFYRSGDYSVVGTLSEEERSILDGWLATVNSKKIEKI